MTSMISLKALLLIYSLLALSQLTTSTDHIVGGQDDGWDIGVDILSWAQGQQFHVGDTLTFKYQAYHDVLEVSKQNYETCTTTNAFSRYTGGSTTIDLKAPGSWYFICGVPRHCNIGMKLEVNVVSSTYPSLPPPSTNDSPPPPVASPPPPPPSPTYYSSPPPVPTPDYSSPATPDVSVPPPPSLTYYSSPPPTPTPDYSSPATPDVSVPPPPSPTYYSSPPPSPTPDYSSPAPPVVSASPPPSTTDPSQPPPSPEIPTPTYTDTPPTVAAPPTTTGCHTPVTPPKPFMAPAPAPKHPKHKKPHHKHGKAPRHAPAQAPNVYKLSKNYVSHEQGSTLITSAAPTMNQLGDFGVISVLTVLMLWVL